MDPPANDDHRLVTVTVYAPARPAETREPTEEDEREFEELRAL